MLDSGDSGVSLPELLVAMVLLSILMTIVVSVFSSFTQTLTRSQSATDSTNVAALGMNEVTRVIRSGTEIEVNGTSTNLTAFRVAKRESAVVYAYLDTNSTTPAPVMVEFAITPSRDLVERRWAAIRVGTFWTFPDPLTATPASSRIIAKKIVVPTAGEAYFLTYLKTDGCPTSQPTCPIVAASGDELSAAERSLIVAVEVTVKVQADPTARAAAVTITNRVGIPNLGRSRVGL